MKIETLVDLTGKVSGVVLFHRERQGICFNWHGMTGVPLYFMGSFFGSLPLPDSTLIPDKINNVQELFKDYAFMSTDRNGGNFRKPKSGKLYKISPAVSVITFKSWQ